MQNSKYDKYISLRNRYSEFTYEGYSIEKQNNTLRLTFDFHINSSFFFRPSHIIRLRGSDLQDLPESMLHNFVFHIGMAELVSYWKATCSPRVIIKPFRLNFEQEQWWKKLFYHGLGEFFYLNGISADPEDFMKMSYTKEATETQSALPLKLKDYYIIPVGGGKDSVLSLELLKNEHSIAMAYNPREAMDFCIDQAGLSNKVYEVQRTIDPQLLELNAQGFLNGHTPFSSVLAFGSALASALTGFRYVALSNEASANEATIPGTKINHQYSKSFEFEQDFRNYVHKYLSPDIEYFSLLRPLNELQIAFLFSKNEKYLSGFRSCNVGSKQGIWCCNCSKCLFTYIMLSPFLSREQLMKIFGEDLFEKESMIPYMKELAGFSKEKPFECVGTIEEVRSALNELIVRSDDTFLPKVLEKFKESIKPSQVVRLTELLNQWNAENFLSTRQKTLIRNLLEIHNN